MHDYVMRRGKRLLCLIHLFQTYPDVGDLAQNRHLGPGLANINGGRFLYCLASKVFLPSIDLRDGYIAQDRRPVLGISNRSPRLTNASEYCPASAKTWAPTARPISLKFHRGKVVGRRHCLVECPLRLIELPRLGFLDAPLF